MINADIDDTFESWRRAARSLVAAGVPPEQILWSAEKQSSLFSGGPVRAESGGSVVVSGAFIRLAEAVACFDGEQKWGLLYRLLYRQRYEEPRLLAIESDRDVRAAREMEKAVNRDVHKFHAFVRFRRVEADEKEIFVAWHEPQHFTVERATPFFARRFGTMTFSILTPRGCAHWDRKQLTFSAPASRSEAPAGDAHEEFWLTYYRSIFNPFRLNVKTMKRELPVRHWATLPEAAIIKELVSEAGAKQG